MPPCSSIVDLTVENNRLLPWLAVRPRASIQSNRQNSNTRQVGASPAPVSLSEISTSPSSLALKPLF
jgi:hypothetical protein